MIYIKRILATAAIAAAAAFGMAGTGIAAPAVETAQYSKIAELELNQVQYRGNSRVCCKRGYRDWWSTYRQCRRQGGHVVANRACRDGRANYQNQRVCCKRGYRDWFSTRGQCRRQGGHVVANRACRDGNVNYQNQRVCCKRGRADWWSTRGQCRQRGGYVTANRQCR